ncbi:DoxX family protein [Gilvibacter sp. SZ-19]|jgi:putative oxidoreductase|uniref:DoxX family protein n=1 Tax=unclassified Gilvibacter TaxID=2625242 RepID=UPI000B3C7D6A|nr:DoxX family protein [Gilvibacter sp. SZ-19]ARV13018.1 DoxX family protein [Gilvibacter sp. SZ-19]
MSVSKNYQTGLLVLRVGLSALMLTHGIPKLMNLFQGDMSFGDPLGIGSTLSFILVVFAEAICPILIILGLRTRLAAIPVIITMAVAAFIVHGDDPFSSMEKALMYLVGFTAIALMGGGKYTIKQLF